MLYRVNITPQEPYTLGTDIGFAMKGENQFGKISYFMQSNNVPDQTTVLGMLRYLVLQQGGLLHTDFKYTQQEQAAMAEKIGAESFSFTASAPQSFGSIQSISPLFLMDETGDYYVKNPFHNTAKAADENTPAKGYCPMALEPLASTACGKEIHLPKQGEYDAKHGHAGGYYNLHTGEIFDTDALIRTQTQVGNRKNGGSPNSDEGFFKRETKVLKQGYSFAVFVEADALPETSIAHLGYRRAVCTVCATPVQQNDLVEQVQAAFAPTAQDATWQYALSDVIPTDALAPDAFCIIEKKQVRNLETVYQADGAKGKMRKMAAQYNLIESGSVFYHQCNITYNENGSNIGYNKIITIGG